MAVFLTLKDVILGIISTLLIIVNDIVRVGDRISSDKHGADGVVVEISLITVKVENLDKTLVKFLLNNIFFHQKHFNVRKGQSKTLEAFQWKMHKEQLGNTFSLT